MKRWFVLFPIILLILTAVVLLASCDSEVVEPVNNPISYTHDEFGNVTGKWEHNSHGDFTKYTRYDEYGNETLTCEYEYNSDYYRTKYTEYYASGAKMHETIYDGTSEQRQLSDTDYDESGNVTSARENEYNSDGYLTKYTEYNNGAKTRETIYDGTSGWRVLSETWYYASGAKEHETIYDGTSGRRILSDTDYDESGNVKSSREKEYNSEGYLTKYTEYYLGTKKREVIYDGTSGRRVLSGTSYDESGNVISTSESEYNSDGYLTKFTEYYMEAKKSETIYDGTSERRMLSDTNYDESGNVKSTDKYEYNSDGYLTKITSYNKWGEKDHEIIYDGTSGRRVLSDAWYHGYNNAFQKKVYEYNSDGYLTKYTEYHMGGKTHEIIYDGTSEKRVLSDTTW